MITKRIRIVRAIDPMTFQPRVGVVLDKELLVKFDIEDQSVEQVVQATKDLLDVELHAEVDEAFRESFLKDLTISKYQEKAIETAIYGEGQAIIYPTLGLTGEAGEVSDKVKKVLRDKGGVFSEQDKIEIAKEVGDVCWYIAALCRDLGISMVEVCQINLDKLASRKARGVISGSGDNR